LAADTMTLDEKSSASPLPYHKIRRFGPHLFAGASTHVSFEIYNLLVADGMVLDPDITKAAHSLYKATRKLYREEYPHKKQGASMLLAGFENDKRANIFTWRFPDDNGPINTSHLGRACIGLDVHSVFFARTLHRDDMRTDQRVQLAHFCIFAAVKMDNSHAIGLPIDAWRLTCDGAKEYSAGELEEFRRRDGEISGQISQLFLA